MSERWAGFASNPIPVPYFLPFQTRLDQLILVPTPRHTLSLGLNVDSVALPPVLVEAIKPNRVNLDDPAVTRILIKDNAVLSVVGLFNDDGMFNAVP